MLPGGATEVAGVEAARLLLERARGRPADCRGVAFNDRCAIGLRDTVVRAGLALPGDLSVVGYDDSPLARLGTVDLTSVSQEPEQLARATVQRLAALLQGDATEPGDVVVSPRLAVRSSSAPPAAAR